MANFLSSLFGRAEKKEEPQQPISELLQQYDEEYIRYCIEQEQTVSALEAYLHTCDDPKEIAMQTLKTACNFYGGNWAGILEVDLEMDVWTPVWWHNPNPGDRTLQLIHEFEAAQFMPSWIQAMSHNEPIILPDISVVKKTLPKRIRSVSAASGGLDHRHSFCTKPCWFPCYPQSKTVHKPPKHDEYSGLCSAPGYGTAENAGQRPNVTFAGGNPERQGYYH